MTLQEGDDQQVWNIRRMLDESAEHLRQLSFAQEAMRQLSHENEQELIALRRECARLRDHVLRLIDDCAQYLTVLNDAHGAKMGSRGGVGLVVVDEVGNA